MLKEQIRKVLITILVLTSITFVVAAETDVPELYKSYPELTDFGDFLCKMTFWRGLPECFKNTVMHGAYVNYPTRQKAKIIVDSFLVDGLYPQDLLISFFGSLFTGNYRPVKSVPVGNYWDSAYFALVKLDQRTIAKRLLMDVVFDRGWAKGKFVNERYKALKVLSDERIISLREYKPLVKYLSEAVQKPDPDMNWINSLVVALSSFREWGDELLPLFRKALEVSTPGTRRPILQTFLDFDIPDDGEFIINLIKDGKIKDVNDSKLCIRVAYILDSESTISVLTDMLNQDTDTLNPDLKTYMVNTLERLKWYGNWEITGSKDTVDPGLEKEKIAFKLKKTLDEADDIVNFSMSMQISWDPGELKPIGMDDTYETNNVSFVVTPEELIFTIKYPLEHTQLEKHFSIKLGTGRNEGRVYLRFPVEGETDRHGKQKYGWIEIEKIS